MKILITGIHGFIGKNLVDALKNSNSLYGLDIIQHNKEGIIKTYKWNQLNDIKEMDIILHLAGKAHDVKNTSKESEYFDVNTGLTKQIFDYYLSSKARKFIFFSSVKAVADTVNSDFLSEDIKPHPLTPYGKSKLEAENYILNKNLSPDKYQIVSSCVLVL